MKKKSDKKTIVLERIAQNLRVFYPELSQHFMCPTCLSVLSLTERSKISEAHIVPRAARGSLKTFICTSCNSKFGANQDRWLGEYYQLRREFLNRKEATILDAPTKPGYFTIDDVRVQGTFRTEADGSLGFYIYEDRTDPDAIRQVLSKYPKTMSFSIPILAKEDIISVGFLTAAYLLWFKELGYSWALQAHLEKVRKQIQNPLEKIIEGRYWVICSGEFFESPWVGVTFIRGETVLIAALADRLVLLPPADKKDPFSILDEKFDSLSSQYQKFHFSDGHQFGKPVGLIYRDRLLISPDIILMERDQGAYIFYPPGEEFRPRMMFSISKEEYESQRTRPNHVLIKMNGQIEIPGKGTGRPESGS